MTMMMTLVDRARMKLAEESSKDSGVTPLEEMLTDRITSSGIAEKILKDDKTLKGAMEKIREEARKGAKKGCGYVSDKRALEIAEEYYGITDTAQTNAGVIDIADFL